MRTNTKTRRVAMMFVAVALTTACDIEPLTKAIDTFDLIVELPRINTLVGGQVIDAATLQPITSAVTLTFGGASAASLIDAYSEPITTSRSVTTGLITFGLANTVTPTTAAPARFTVTASAAGYRTATETVLIDKTGSSDFVIQLIPNGGNAAIAGTSGATTSGFTATAGTVVTPSTVTTAPLPGATSASSVTIPAGTTLSTASGTPLSGALTADVRFFAGEGLSVLPENVRTTGGAFRQTIGAVTIEIRDASGNVAGDANSASAMVSGFGARMLSSQPVGSTVAFRIGLSPTAFTAIQSAVSAGNVLRGLNFNGTAIAGCSITLDAAANTLVLNGCGSSGRITIVLEPATGAVATCAANGTVALRNPNATSVTLTRIGVASPFFTTAERLSLSIRAGQTVTVNLNAATGGVNVPTGSNYTLTVEADGRSTSLSNINPCTGTSTLDLPTVPSQAEFTIVATISCPSGQKLDPGFTSASLDGLSLFYTNITGAPQAPKYIARSQLSASATPSVITITVVNVGLTVSTNYRFSGVFGTKSGNTTATSPAAGGTFNLPFTADNIGLTCKAI